MIVKRSVLRISPKPGKVYGLEAHISRCTYVIFYCFLYIDVSERAIEKPEGRRPPWIQQEHRWQTTSEEKARSSRWGIFIRLKWSPEMSSEGSSWLTIQSPTSSFLISFFFILKIVFEFYKVVRLWFWWIILDEIGFCSQEGSKPRAGHSKNTRMVNASFITGLSYLGKTEDPLLTDNCCVNLDSLRAKEALAIRWKLLFFNAKSSAFFFAKLIGETYWAGKRKQKLRDWVLVLPLRRRASSIRCLRRKDLSFFSFFSNWEGLWIIS